MILVTKKYNIFLHHRAVFNFDRYEQHIPDESKVKIFLFRLVIYSYKMLNIYSNSYLNRLINKLLWSIFHAATN